MAFGFRVFSLLLSKDEAAMQGTAVHCGGYKAGNRNSKEPNTRQLEDIAWIINWRARLYGFGWKQVGTQRLTKG